MSLPPVSVTIDVGQFPGAGVAALRNELVTILRVTLRNVIRKLTLFLRQIVPEDTGKLLQSSLTTLQSSTSSNSLITVKYGYPAPYAEYVNQMVGVNWTKPGSQSHFYEKGLIYLHQQLRLELEIQIRKRIDSTRNEGVLRLLFALQAQLHTILAGIGVSL